MENSPYPDSTDEKEGKFNMGIRTLIRIDEIIFKINEISVALDVDKAQAQHLKFSFIKQLQIRAAPLMPEEENKKIKVRLDEIKLKFFTEHDSYTGKVESRQEIYDPKVETLLNDIVEDIELALQKEGCYFMPNKGEEALF
jgi:hypothetical protein